MLFERREVKNEVLVSESRVESGSVVGDGGIGAGASGIRRRRGDTRVRWDARLVVPERSRWQWRDVDYVREVPGSCVLLARF